MFPHTTVFTANEHTRSLTGTLTQTAVLEAMEVGQSPQLEMML